MQAVKAGGRRREKRLTRSRKRSADDPPSDGSGGAKVIAVIAMKTLPRKASFSCGQSHTRRAGGWRSSLGQAHRERPHPIAARCIAPLAVRESHAFASCAPAPR